MIERLTDGLKMSASRAVDFMKAEDKDKPELFTEFLNGIKVAAGSAHQLAYHQQNPQFFKIRDILEGILDVGKTLPVFTNLQAGLWFRIKNSLEEISYKARKIASSKSLTRQEVLHQIDVIEADAKERLHEEVGE